MTHSYPASGGSAFEPDVLLSHTAGHLALAHRLLVLFMTDLPARVMALTAALHAGDGVAVRQHAHTLKGTSLTVGAVGLAELAQAMEEQASEPNMSSGLTELSKMIDVTQAAMQNWMKQTPNGSIP